MTELLIVSSLSGLVWFGALHQAFYDYWTATVFFAAITGLALLLLGASLARQTRIRLPLALPLGICLGAMALSLRHSFDFTVTLWDVLGWAYTFIAYVMFVNTATQPQTRRLFYATASAVLIPLCFIALRQTPWAFNGGAVFSGASHATLVNANALAGFCLFWVFPLFFAHQPTVVEKIARACVVALLMLSGSWAAWMALAIGGLYLRRERPHFRSWAAAIACGAALMGLAKFGPWNPAGPKNWARISYFKAALHMARSEPMTGVGLGAYGVAYSYFKTPGVENTRLAHSFPLQMAAESGAAGSLAWLFLGACFFGAQKRAAPAEDPVEREVVRATLLAVLSYSLLSISLDYLLNRYVAFLLLAALTDRSAWGSLAIERSSVKIVAMALLLAGPAFWLRLFRAEQLYSAGYYAQALAFNPRHGDSWARLADAAPDPSARRQALRAIAWHWKKIRPPLVAGTAPGTP